MTQKLKLGFGDAVFGAIVIDFEKKKVEWYYMDGCSSENPEPREIVAICEEAEAKGHYAAPLLFWKDVDQLSVHDIGGFLAEVYEDEEEEDESEDGE